MANLRNKTTQQKNKVVLLCRCAGTKQRQALKGFRCGLKDFQSLNIFTFLSFINFITYVQVVMETDEQPLINDL